MSARQQADGTTVLLAEIERLRTINRRLHRRIHNRTDSVRYWKARARLWQQRAEMFRKAKR